MRSRARPATILCRKSGQEQGRTLEKRRPAGRNQAKPRLNMDDGCETFNLIDLLQDHA